VQRLFRLFVGGIDRTAVIDRHDHAPVEFIALLAFKIKSWPAPLSAANV